MDQFAPVASNNIHGCQTYLIFYLFPGNFKLTAHLEKTINCNNFLTSALREPYDPKYTVSALFIWAFRFSQQNTILETKSLIAQNLEYKLFKFSS